MKKNLLIAIALAMALSAYFASCCGSVDRASQIGNGNFSFQIYNYHTNRSMIGFGGYPSDSIKFAKLNSTLFKGEVSTNGSGIVLYYFVGDFLDTSSTGTYRSSLLVTYPDLPNFQLPYGGDTDTVKCVYHVSKDKCDNPRIDNAKIYFNDSLYYQGNGVSSNPIFYKF